MCIKMSHFPQNMGLALVYVLEVIYSTDDNPYLSRHDNVLLSMIAHLCFTFIKSQYQKTRQLYPRNYSCLIFLSSFKEIMDIIL